MTDGRYSPVPGDPFRWLPPVTRTPNSLAYRAVFPHGVPLRDSDLTPEQRAYLASGRRFA